MRLSELFEDTSVEKERDFQAAWVAAQKALKASGIPPSRWGNIKADAHKNMSNLGQEVDDAISTAIDAERYAIQAKRSRGDTQSTSAKTSEPKPARDRVRPTITTPDADRTRQDTLGRNLKADRYYNQLNKTPKGRELIKRAVAKLGVPEPAVDQIIDVIADDVPQAINQLDTILKNPAAGIKARQARNQST